MRRRTFFAALIAGIAAAASGATLTVRSAVAELCSKLKLTRRVLVLPPLPQWNPLTADFDSADFARSSLDYERSLLPDNVVFPQVGQVCEAIDDCEVRFRAWCPIPIAQTWARVGGPLPNTFPSPLTGGKLRLQRGEKVRVQELDDSNRPLWV